MHDMTAANLRSAHGGESMAHMRYKVWAERAHQENFPNVSRLFKAIAFAEEVHGSNHFRELRGVGGAFPVTAMAGFGLSATSQNLAGAIEGELFEVHEMYPAYRQVAQAQEEKGADRSFQYALLAEAQHAALYQKAKASVDSGKDVALGPVQVCRVCGYTVEGEAPERCPVCNVAKDKFAAFA